MSLKYFAVPQSGKSALMHALTRGDLPMFEFLTEQGVEIPSGFQVTSALAAISQRRQEWIEVAVALARRYDIPLTALRTVHEFLVGDNWATVYQAIKRELQ